jgi:hypothetical protein
MNNRDSNDLITNQTDHITVIAELVKNDRRMIFCMIILKLKTSKTVKI